MPLLFFLLSNFLCLIVCLFFRLCLLYLQPLFSTTEYLNKMVWSMLISSITYAMTLTSNGVNIVNSICMLFLTLWINNVNKITLFFKTCLKINLHLTWLPLLWLSLFPWTHCFTLVRASCCMIQCVCLPVTHLTPLTKHLTARSNSTWGHSGFRRDYQTIKWQETW